MIDLKKTSTKLASKETNFFPTTFFSYKDINKTHTKVPTTYNIKCCMQKKTFEMINIILLVCEKL